MKTIPITCDRQPCPCLEAMLVVLWIAPVAWMIFVPAAAGQEKSANDPPRVFKSREEADRARKQRELQTQTNILEQMKTRGAFPEEVNAEKEGFQLMNSGVQVRTWETWTNHYQAKLALPPITFDVTEQSPPDFSDPVAALRSYFRALQVGDAPTLLKHSSDSGRLWLKRRLNVDENANRPTFQIFPKLTRFTVLLTAENRFAEKDYVLVLFRAEERANPRQGLVALDARIFERVGDTLLITGDLDQTSPFGNVRGAARAYQPIGRYPAFHEAMRQSEFPPYFYTIEEDD